MDVVASVAIKKQGDVKILDALVCAAVVSQFYIRAFYTGGSQSKNIPIVNRDIVNSFY